MNLFLKYAAFAAVATSVTLASCNDDGDDPVVAANSAPTVEIQNADGSANDSLRFVDAQAGTPVAVNIKTADADSDIKSITFDVDGSEASVGSIRVGSATTQIEQNPLLITSDRGGSTTTYYFSAPVSPGESVEYTVTVQDDEGATASEDFTILAALPLTTLDGILLNAAGPDSTGGLILASGQPVNSVDSAAGIIDLGIDDKIDGQVAENWRQQIGPGNDATLHIVSEKYLSESQSFGDISTKSQIRAAFDVTSVDETRSNKLEGGEVFAVLKDGVYYLLEVQEVRLKDQSNSDSYLFNIKY